MGKLLQLETERLILRPLTPKDTDFVYQHFSDPAVSRYLLDEEPPTRRDQAVELIQFYLDPIGKTYNRWGIVWKATDALVGTCGYHKWHRQHRRAEIGYDLGQAHWGQGMMAEALHAMLGHGFEEMGLNRVEALVHPENGRSIGLLEKLGFQREGLLRQYYNRGGEFFDHMLLSLLRGEWGR